ncbi:hypothetical protein K443DRAFT_657600 [Laccaria amethystina LaAM-08-1]|uniref:Uncharacterized protein n=1 Tax=Laccaria amethystina LaAM-08-1 TaxID=1095629 RepID=A0A0C9WS36_9AGAR|nr:hypothetical protein K443DRAFT_657600 [Laccaria amethystina LaAM-08-1]
MTNPTLPHDHTADHCECANCRNTLTVKGPAASGIAPGHLYIHCNSCGYHYTFPKWCQRITHRSPALVISAGSSSRKQVVRRASHATTVADKQCATTTCAKGANMLCSNKSCKNCCIAKGGCKISSHHRDMISKRERKKVAHLMPAPRPYSFRPPSPLIELSQPPLTMSPPSPVDFNSRSASIFDDWPNPVRDMEKRRIQEEKERIERERAEAEAERQEEQEYQTALAASLGLDHAPSTHHDSLPTTSSSHTSIFFNEGDQHVSLLLPSLLDSGSVSSDAPATSRMPVATAPVLYNRSVTKIGDMPKLPTITRHLNAEWMRPFEDLSQSQLPKKGRSQVDLDLSRKFHIMFWDKPDEDPSTFSVLDCPAWPKWVLADSTTALQRLASAPDLDFYDPKDRLWLWADLAYPHEVSKDSYIFFRRRGIRCHDFQKHLDQVLAKPPHQRVNMRGKRDSVNKGLRAKKEKEKRQPPNVMDNNNSDIEFTDVTPRRHTIKHNRSLSPLDGELSACKRLRTTSPIISPIPLSSPLSISETLRSLSPSPNESISGSSPTPRIRKEVWYTGLYVVDVAKGLKLFNANRSVGKWQSKFSAAFNLPPPPRRSFYDQRDRWLIATQAQRDTALAAGRTLPGLWSAFVRDVPLK